MWWLFILIPFAVLLFVIIKLLLNEKKFHDYLKDSLIVFGKKGHGKSLLFSKIALYSSKKFDGYLSNIPFNFSGEKLINISEGLSVMPNTPTRLLEGKTSHIQKKDFENKPVLLDDCAIYLPNYLDNVLKKVYPSLPVSYALWRHLYNAPIYLNSQSVKRTYVLIREQSDGFLKARRCFRVGPFMFIKCTYYSNIDSAEQDLAPMPKKFLAADKNTYYEYLSLHGEIKDFTLVAFLPKHTYDSRFYHRVFFGFPSSDSPLDSPTPINTGHPAREGCPAGEAEKDDPTGKN